MSGEPGAVRLQVDEETCVGMGQCELLEPDVFRVDDDTSIASAADVAVPADRATAVIEACPSGAISVRNEVDG